MGARELVVLGTASQVPTRPGRTRRRCCAGTRGRAVRPGRGHAAPADPGRDLGGQHHPDLRHPPARRPLPRAARRAPAHRARRPWSARRPVLPRGRAALRRPPAERERGRHGPEVREHPVVDRRGGRHLAAALVLSARALDHRVPTYGWRLQEPDGRGWSATGSRRPGSAAPASAGCCRTARSTVDGRRVLACRGHRAASGPDLRLRHGHPALRRGRRALPRRRPRRVRVDLPADRGRAGRALRGTSRRPTPPRIAAEAGVRRLVLTHYSARHPDEQVFADEARSMFSDVLAARDLDRIEVPLARRLTQGADADPCVALRQAGSVRARSATRRPTRPGRTSTAPLGASGRPVGRRRLDERGARRPQRERRTPEQRCGVRSNKEAEV